MTPRIHPEAAKRFDELAAGVHPKMTGKVITEPRRSGFAINPHVSGVLTDADIPAPGMWSDRAPSGEEVSRFTTRDGNVIGIAGEAFKELRQLSEKMQLAPALRDVASVDTVFDALFQWACSGSEESATEFVLQVCENAVADHEILIPIFDLFIESPIRIGGVLLRTIEEDEIESWTRHLSDQHPEYQQSFTREADELKRELQGKAAAEVRIRAEPIRAHEAARQAAEDAVSLLRIYSQGMLEPRIRSYCTLRGSENVQRSTHVVIREGKYVGRTQILLAPLGTIWMVSREHAVWMMQAGLSHMSKMLSSSSRTAFQEKLLEALLTYSRAALQDGIAEKLLYIVVALETILLKNDTEPIQTSVAERFAFTIGSNQSERKEIGRLVRAAYALRSRFVHHGQQISDLDTMRNFMRSAFVFFAIVAQRHEKYVQPSDYLDELDNLKWA
jgi:hypothetical protein